MLRENTRNTDLLLKECDQHWREIEKFMFNLKQSTVFYGTVNNYLIFKINNTFVSEFFITFKMLVVWKLLKSNNIQGMFLLGFKAKVPLHSTKVEMSSRDGSESCYNASYVPA